MYVTRCSQSSSVRPMHLAPAIRSVVSAATPGGADYVDVIAGRAYVQVGGDHAPGRVAGQERQRDGVAARMLLRMRWPAPAQPPLPMRFSRRRVMSTTTGVSDVPGNLRSSRCPRRTRSAKSARTCCVSPISAKSRRVRFTDRFTQPVPDRWLLLLLSAVSGLHLLVPCGVTVWTLRVGVWGR